MLILTQKMIYADDIRANPHALYLFGDNLARKGLGGQAKEMRGHPNSFGIVTKRKPEHGDPSCYFHDHEEDAWHHVRKDFAELNARIKNDTRYRVIVVPADGLGTGLAHLPTKAPALLQFIELQIKELRKL